MKNNRSSIIFVLLVIILMGIAHKLEVRENDNIKNQLTSKVQSLETENINMLKKYSNLKENSSLINFKLEDLKNHLMTHYKETSTYKKNQIFNTIIEESKKYNFNPLILYSIIHNESSFRFWIRHSTISIHEPLNSSKTKSKKVKTRAIGLMGVVYEIWKYDLKKENILETKMDLMDPIINIRAGAFILDHYRSKPKLKGTSTHIESALLRYFGVLYNENKSEVDKIYYEKISGFVGSLIKNKIFNDEELLTKQKKD